MDNPEKLGDEIRAVLSDKKRPGIPPVFTPDQVMRVIDLACSNPNDFGYEVNQWSLPLLVTKIKKHGIAELAETCAPDVELSKKGKTGILKSMESRRIFCMTLPTGYALSILRNTVPG